jgi:hypothetical protein
VEILEILKTPDKIQSKRQKSDSCQKYPCEKNLRGEDIENFGKFWILPKIDYYCSQPVKFEMQFA